MRPILAFAAALALAAFAPEPPGTQAVLEATTAADWRPLDPENTLYLELESGRVVMELAPHFAPNTVANIKTLVREGFFDGTSINRVQDNYVVQWGDATTEKPLGSVAATLAPEFERTARTDDFTAIPGPDGYADRVGFSKGFAAAEADGRQWLTHCYGALGVGRGDAPDSGNGAELYVVIGHAPRNLDRNVAVVGQVLQGVELLSALPRGTDALGFYETEAERVPIERMRIAADVPEAERTELEVLRTDTPAFAAWVDARANRARDGWYSQSQGFVDLCNVRLPVRPAAPR